MSKKITNMPFNGIYLEITSQGLGDISIGGGIEFEDDVGEEFKEMMENLLAGLMSSLSASFPAIVTLGAATKDIPNFDWESIGVNYETHNSTSNNVVEFPTRKFNSKTDKVH